MKILNAGTHLLSNADVLDWIKLKRLQHAREDEEDKCRGLTGQSRPKNFMLALKRHEQELSSPEYPYTKNPSVYDGANRNASFKKFALEAENVIRDRLEEEWRERLETMTKQQIDKEFIPLQDRKCLTEPELLTIFNHAPTSLELLLPMIDNVEERFTGDEQQLLFDIVKSTLRCDENNLVQNN